MMVTLWPSSVLAVSSSADMECGGGELSDSGSSGYWSWDHGNVSPATSPSVAEMDSSPDEGLHMELEQGEELNAKKPKVQSNMSSNSASNNHLLILSTSRLFLFFCLLLPPLPRPTFTPPPLSHRALSEVCISVCGPVVAKFSRLQLEWNDTSECCTWGEWEICWFWIKYTQI